VVRHGDEQVDNTVSGGIFFSDVIQGHDITVVLPPQITPAMAGLPTASAAFTGRDHDLDTLLEALDPRQTKEGALGTIATAAGAPVVVTAIGGMGGIGKTELALQASHIVLGRGWFPGGVLFTNMFGYDPGRRLTAAQAAAGFVRALGIPGEHIPADAQDVERLLRSALDAYARQGRPVLIVIDNVSDMAQAAPLLPAHPACRAIVTSRHTLGLLDARLIDLDILGTGDAVELLRRTIQVARPRDQRVTSHPGDAQQVAEACGRLPLALRLAAALLADNPGKPLAAMASDLHDQADGLAELSYGSVALTTAFDLSYNPLPVGQARLFRLLSLNPGPDIATMAGAALAGLREAEARRSLEALARAHLIEPGGTYGRWRLHDLIRLHSARHGTVHADADQRPEALTRLLAYYLVTTRAASAHLVPHVVDPALLDFPTREEALAWLDAEYLNLAAATYAAAGNPSHLTTARDLPNAMWHFLLLRRHFSDWITLSQTALTAARDLHDQHGQATALIGLGAALQGLRRFEEAITVCREAAQVFRDTDDRHGEAIALGNLGAILRQARRFEEAVTADQEYLQICRNLSDRHGQGMALDNIGSALQGVRRFKEAITAHQDAAQLFQETGDRHDEARALSNLGSALQGARRFEEAITAHLKAAQFFQDTGDRHSEGSTLNNLGTALQRALRFEEAITAHQHAAEIYQETRDWHGEGMAVDNLGTAFQGALRLEEAITAHQDAAQIFQDTGDLHSEGMAVDNLGVALREAHRLEEAITAHQQAAEIFQDTGDRHSEGMALDNLAAALQEVHQLEEAIAAWQQSAQIFRETGDRHGEEHSLNNLRETRQAQDGERELSPRSIEDAKYEPPRESWRP
jgi:tetratricopeptide (TPR) repeat protein